MLRLLSVLAARRQCRNSRRGRLEIAEDFIISVSCLPHLPVAAARRRRAASRRGDRRESFAQSTPRGPGGLRPRRRAYPPGAPPCVVESEGRWRLYIGRRGAVLRWCSSSSPPLQPVGECLPLSAPHSHPSQRKYHDDQNMISLAVGCWRVRLGAYPGLPPRSRGATCAAPRRSARSAYPPRAALQRAKDETETAKKMAGRGDYRAVLVMARRRRRRAALGLARRPPCMETPSRRPRS